MAKNQKSLKRTFEKTHVKSGTSNMVRIFTIYKTNPIGDLRKNSLEIRSFRYSPDM